MSRRIQTKARTLASGGQVDDYWGRLIKYIPAEVVALYVSATGIVPANHTDSNFYLWIIFGFCFIATPLYFIGVTRDPANGPLWLQVLLASIAFPVWAYALGGVFVNTPKYEPFAASLLLMGVTFIFGKIRPS